MKANYRPITVLEKVSSMAAKDKRILVTGGAGFIGSHVAEYFANKGSQVVVLDNLSRHKLLGKTGRRDVVYHNWNYLKDRKVKLIRGDVRNIDDLMKVCKDVDIVVHAAAQTAVTSSVTSPDVDFSINVVGTANLLETIRRVNDSATLVFCSTNKVYGERVNNIQVIEGEQRYRFEEEYAKGISEDFGVDLCGHTPYGCSKLTGDVYAQDYAHTYGMRTGVFRMSCIYGIRQFGIEDQGWLAWFTIAALTGKPITIYGDGKQVRDVLFVTDLVRAYEVFIERSEQLRGEVFNMGGGPENTLSLLELLSLLRELTGRESKVSYSDWRPADQKVYITDIEKARKQLGWSPRVGPREGVKRLSDWVASNSTLFT